MKVPVPSSSSRRRTVSLYQCFPHTGTAVPFLSLSWGIKRPSSLRPDKSDQPPDINVQPVGPVCQGWSSGVTRQPCSRRSSIDAQAQILYRNGEVEWRHPLEERNETCRSWGFPQPYRRVMSDGTRRCSCYTLAFFFYWVSTRKTNGECATPPQERRLYGQPEGDQTQGGGAHHRAVV